MIIVDSRVEKDSDVAGFNDDTLSAPEAGSMRDTAVLDTKTNSSLRCCSSIMLIHLKNVHAVINR